MKNLFLLILAAFIIISCNESNQEPINKDAIKSETVSDESGESQTASPGKSVGEEIPANTDADAETVLGNTNLRSKSPNLSPEKISEFLPKKMLGADRGAITLYQSDDGYTQAMAVYKFNINKGFELRILDNGPNGVIQDERFYRKMPVEVGMITRKLSSENSIGFVLTSEDDGRANLSILFDNRLNILIKTFGFAPKDPSPEDLLKSIKINDILDLLKK